MIVLYVPFQNIRQGQLTLGIDLKPQFMDESL